MKIKKIVKLSIVLFLFGAIQACKKEGCTNKMADNFCNNCKSGQTCQFSANILFYFDDSTSLYLSKNGVNTLEYLLEGESVGSSAIEKYTNSEPECGQKDVVSVSVNLKDEPTRHVGYEVKDEFGNIVWKGEANLEAKTCLKIKLDKEGLIEPIVEIKTSFGDMYMWLNKKTPKHRANFLKLAGANFFDSTLFHRCVANFVIQGGDPLSKDANPSNDGTGGPGYTIDAEIDSTRYRHYLGAVGSARDNNPQKKSNGSQYYIVTGPARFLDGNYTVFGKLIKGLEVATAINKQPKNGDVPKVKTPMDINILLKTRQELRDQFGFTEFEW